MNIKKSKLAKELSKEHPKTKYFPEIGEVNLWFKIINQEIFGNELDSFRKIEIHRRHRVWGECIGCRPHVREMRRDGFKLWSELSLNHYMKSKDHFIETLAHEMVHHYQWLTYSDMDHGTTFYEWKPKFQKFGITLAEAQ